MNEIKIIYTVTVYERTKTGLRELECIEAKWSEEEAVAFARKRVECGRGKVVAEVSMTLCTPEEVLERFGFDD